MTGEVRGHIIGHVSNNVISWSWYWKDVQTTFLKKLIIILRRRQLCAKDRYKSKKVDNFSLSQKVGFVCR